MNEILTNGFLTFFSGLLIGVLITNRWKKSSNVKEPTESKLDNFSDSNLGENKLVMIVRTDLKMGKGKVAAQCSHAAVSAYESSQKKIPKIFSEWRNSGQPKIVVKIDSEEEMMDLAALARTKEILVSIVRDAGRTQVASGTRTVMAIGPGPKQIIDLLTGHLKLY